MYITNKASRVTSFNNKTRLHSSRMHTARSLTVSTSMLCCGGGRGAWSGGCLVWGVPGLGGAWSGGCLVLGVPGLGGGCLVWGVYLVWGYLPGIGGLPAWSLGGLVRGVPGRGVCVWSGGTCLVPEGVVSQHALRQTPSLLTEFLTHASENITLPQTFFAGSN